MPLPVPVDLGSLSDQRLLLLFSKRRCLLWGGCISMEVMAENTPRDSQGCVANMKTGCPGTLRPPPACLQSALHVMLVKHMAAWCELVLIFFLNAYTDVLWVLWTCVFN